MCILYTHIAKEITLHAKRCLHRHKKRDWQRFRCRRGKIAFLLHRQDIFYLRIQTLDIYILCFRSLHYKFDSVNASDSPENYFQHYLNKFIIRVYSIYVLSCIQNLWNMYSFLKSANLIKHFNKIQFLVILLFLF